MAYRCLILKCMVRVRLGVMGVFIVLIIWHLFNNSNKYNHLPYYYCITYNVQQYCCVETDWIYMDSQ